MIWFAVRILKGYFQSSDNQYMPSPPAPPPLHMLSPSTLCWAGMKGQESQGLLTFCASSPPALAGRNHGAWNFVNMRFLLNALGKVNPSPGRGKTPPSFQNWTVRPSLNHRTQLPQRKPGWPHCGHIKAKHTSSLGTFLLQVLDGKAVMAPTLTLQVPGHLRVPG